MLTPFRFAVIPPPLCAATISLSVPVNHCSYGPEQDDELLVVTSDNMMTFYNRIQGQDLLANRVPEVKYIFK